MKQLQLPRAAIIRFNLDAWSAAIENAEVNSAEDIAIIEKNGFEILSAAIMLEERMIEGASEILFGKEKDARASREFFAGEVMGTSDFSYAFKRRVFTRLLEQFQIIDSQAVKSLKAGLNKVMEWRNAFAHGQVVTELGGGYILQYYSGGRKELQLNDDFFQTVESTIRSCLYTCNGVIQSTSERT